MYPEISNISIDDLVDKYCGRLDNLNSYKKMVDIYMSIFERLDIFYEIYVSYNISYCINLDSMKQMSWAAFREF